MSGIPSLAMAERCRLIFLRRFLVATAVMALRCFECSYPCLEVERHLTHKRYRFSVHGGGFLVFFYDSFVEFLSRPKNISKQSVCGKGIKKQTNKIQEKGEEQLTKSNKVSKNILKKCSVLEELCFYSLSHRT